MLNFIKKKIRSIFGIGETQHVHIEKKNVKPEIPHSREKRHVGNRSAAGKTHFRDRQEERRISPLKADGIPVKKLPSKPGLIIEFPPEEGKSRFIDLPIAKDIMYGIQDLGFKYCTTIQEQTLPFLLAGRDLSGKAQTGTGKTAAFLIAAFTALINNPLEKQKPGSCRVLIMAPTRELAIQIYKDAEALSKYTPFNNLVVFGGMDHKKQRECLCKPIDILIGTPGRIIDYSHSRHLDLSQAEILVIDEADRMLDMGFIPDVKRIIAQLPPAGKRQTLLFSATLDESILRLARNWLVNPVVVESEPEQIVGEQIEQVFYSVAIKEKINLLLWLLHNEDISRMLIFGNRKDRNQDLVSALQRHGISCSNLSGDVPQHKRLQILDNFKNGAEKILVATDVAARGIHVDDVSHVINYDLPERAEDYVHRIGRTGRAGKNGKSISFICEYGAYSIPAIEEYIGNRISCIVPESEMLVPQKKKNVKK